ncbi:MAG: hypothetical protein OHK0039_00520 [Bacteroidia bacterium]
MDLIYDIVKKLRKQEIRQIKQLIRQSPFEYDKMGKLFDLVTRHDMQEESFYAQKLYGKEPDNTFRVTKSRLKRIMENVLLNDKSLSGYPEAITTKLQIRKRLLQGEILLGRGAYIAAKNLLLQVIAAAQKYDLYDEHFEAELLLARNLSVRTPVKEYEKHTQKLLQINRLKASIHEAQILYYSISNLLLNKVLKPDQKDEVRKQIDQMKGIADETHHPQVLNLYFLAEIYYLQIDSRDQEALAVCQQYVVLLQREPTLYSKQRLAVAYGHLAQVNLRLGRNAEARHFATQALSMFSPEEMNYLRGLELCFIIAYHDRAYDEAHTLIEQARTHPEFDTSRLSVARWHYFQACLYFGRGAFQEAYHALNETTPLLADKYGTNLNIRLLEIMIMYEMAHLDLLEAKILNMRQFIKRTQKNEELRRPKLLLRLLARWHKHQFDFAKTIEESATDLRALDRMPGGSVLHNPSIDLVRLEDWMKEKAARQG